MTKTQWYIGAPNGVVLCVDGLSGGEIAGRLYHGYRADARSFDNTGEMVARMEALYDALNFPHPGSNERRFFPSAREIPHYTEKDRIMKDESLLAKHGDLGTFIVRVQHRQNSSWQGRITWMEQDKTISFRSVWEMVKLIENAVETVSTEEDQKTPNW